MRNPWEDPDVARRWANRIASGNPHRTEQIDVLCVLAGAMDPKRILDLGVGAGLVAQRLLRRFPEAELTGLDGSSGMLEEARLTLHGLEGRIRLVQGRLDRAWPEEVGTAYDLVFSVQSIHHVPADAKKEVFRRAFAALRPGGTFLVSDRLAFDERLFAFHRRLWNRARVQGGYAPHDEAYGPEAYRANLAESGDMPERLDTQLAWLREVGFDPVDCFWQHADRAAFGGLRPPTG